MKSKTNSVGLTYQDGKGFKKCIGFYDHEDGRRLPKIHWLGHDENHARYLAFSLQKAWTIMQADGPRGWKPEDISNVKAFLATGADMMRDAMNRADRVQQQIGKHQADIVDVGSFVQPVRARESKPAAPQQGKATRPMLYAAIEAYKTSIKGKRTSDKHKQRAEQVVEVNLKAVRKDCPLADVDFAWIDVLCDHYKNRPANLKDGRPVSPAGVKNVLTYLRLFFQWLDDTGWGQWEGPRKLLKPFKVRIDDLMTPVELRAAGTIKQFDVPTLKTLYHAATPYQRAIMLTALFTGATQQELAVLEKSEFDLATGMLHHFRNKTHVEGKYWLPPELVSYLRKDFAKRRRDTLAFRTAEGHALVTFTDGKQTSDAVRQSWDDLRDEAELPDALSFKYLRKFLADWMTKAGGEVMGQVALSHSPTTVLGKNYTSARDFEEFHKLQKKMHRELKKAGVFKAESKGKLAAA